MTPPLPQRDPAGHKGDFGAVLVVGGCAGRPTEQRPEAQVMIGGPAFTALAALRAGCGLVRLALPEPVLPAALTVAPSATGVPLPVDASGRLVPHLCAQALDPAVRAARCIAVGPGLGAGPEPQAVVLRLAGLDACPVVLDADALNCLAAAPGANLDLRGRIVLTPHTGEFRRLAAAFALPDDTADPARAAERLARALGCVVVLKGARTAVTDGYETSLLGEPNPALATAGSGDVLTGVVASFIAQHHRRGLALRDCAALAVTAHARAAARWARDRAATGGMLAQDIIDNLPEAVESLRSGPRT